MLQTAKQAYPSAISLPLEPLVEFETFEYSRDMVQLEDEPSSENLQNSLYTCMNIV